MFVAMDTPLDFTENLESSQASGAVLDGGCFGSSAGAPSEISASEAGSLLQTCMQSGLSSLPPDLAKGVGAAQPLLTAGISGILSGDGLSAGLSGGLDSMFSPGGVMGVAGQFLPPQVGQYLPMAMALASGNPMAMVSAVMAKFIPPELQGVMSAAMQSGMPGTIADAVFPNPDAPQSVDESSTLAPAGGAAPFAARIGDMHVCPAFDGPKPHVGGIIVKGFQSVLIGGQPAARLGDFATCVGPPDTITSGELTVKIGSQPAARVTDSTAHGGTIVLGLPTVWIGKTHSPGKSLRLNAACYEAGAKSAAARIK